MTAAERNRHLADAARHVERALAGLYGSVEFHVQEGRVRKCDVHESVKLETAMPRACTAPFGVPPEE